MQMKNNIAIGLFNLDSFEVFHGPELESIE